MLCLPTATPALITAAIPHRSIESTTTRQRWRRSCCGGGTGSGRRGIWCGPLCASWRRRARAAPRRRRIPLRMARRAAASGARARWRRCIPRCVCALRWRLIELMEVVHPFNQSHSARHNTGPPRRCRRPHLGGAAAAPTGPSGRPRLQQRRQCAVVGAAGLSGVGRGGREWVRGQARGAGVRVARAPTRGGGGAHGCV